jgi:hypothetical protein
MDRAGVVEIVFDADGRPDAVRLRPDWRGAVGVGGLAAAVREAWSAAVLDRLGAWATATADPDPVVEAPADDVAARRRAAREDTNDGPPPAGTNAGTAESALPAALVGAAAGRDPSGRVVAEISGGELTALRVDEGWARVADEVEIGAAVLAALVEAFGVGSVDGATRSVAGATADTGATRDGVRA